MSRGLADSLFGVGEHWAGSGGEVLVAQAVAVAFQGDDLGVVDEGVDHRGGHGVVAEDLTPTLERFVAGHDHQSAFVAGRHELEDQVRGGRVERDVADLGEARHPFGGRRERDPPPGEARTYRVAIARWVLPVPGGPNSTTFSRPCRKSS